jgi:hypothetical protein
MEHLFGFLIQMVDGLKFGRNKYPTFFLENGKHLVKIKKFHQTFRTFGQASVKTHTNAVVINTCVCFFISVKLPPVKRLIAWGDGTNVFC